MNKADSINFPCKSERGIPFSSSWENLASLLHLSQLEFRENILSKRVEIYRNGKLESTELELVATELINDALEYNLRLKMHDVIRSIMYIAHINRYNPWKDFLESCYADWDGNKRFDEFFSAFTLDRTYNFDSDFLKLLMKKWMVSAICIADNSGDIIPQGILVLMGPQGIGKTRFVRWLMPDARLVLIGSYLDLDSRDSLMMNTSRAIVELGELGESVKKRNKVKAFLTRGFDTYRRMWGLHDTSYPRMTSYIGTTNEVFLTDVTGSRRFWTLPIANINYSVLDKIDVYQLWGEIYDVAIKQRAPYYLSDDERDRLNRYNLQFLRRSSDEQAILDAFDWSVERSNWTEYTASDVCRLVHLTGNHQAQVGKILYRMVCDGTISLPVHHHNTGKRFYLLPPVVKMI